MQFELMVTYFTPESAEDAAGRAQGSQPNQRGSLSNGQVQQYAMAQFRCAATTGLDQHMPLIGIPNFLPNTAEGNRAFYFVALKPVLPQQPQQQQQQLQQSQLQVNNSSSAHSGSTASSGAAGNAAASRRPVRKMASFSLMATDGPFQDIKLGPLLGKGAFGRVYRGTWRGCETHALVQGCATSQRRRALLFFQAMWHVAMRCTWLLANSSPRPVAMHLTIGVHSICAHSALALVLC
jgi:hypothetical protein